MICAIRNTLNTIVKVALNTAMILFAVVGIIYTTEHYTPESEAVHVEPPQLTAEQLADRAALMQGINPALVRAVMHVESRGDAVAISPKGAIGLMQIMPANYERCGLEHPGKLYEPDINVACGA